MMNNEEDNIDDDVQPMHNPTSIDIRHPESDTLLATIAMMEDGMPKVVFYSACDAKNKATILAAIKSDTGYDLRFD